MLKKAGNKEMTKMLKSIMVIERLRKYLSLVKSLAKVFSSFSFLASFVFIEVEFV